MSSLLFFRRKIMEAKRTVKTDIKFKDLVMKEHQIVDFESGEVVNLIANLEEVYGDEPFSLACTAKSEEIIELESNDFD